MLWGTINLERELSKASTEEGKIRILVDVAKKGKKIPIDRYEFAIRNCANPEDMAVIAENAAELAKGDEKVKEFYRLASEKYEEASRIYHGALEEGRLLKRAAISSEKVKDVDRAQELYKRAFQVYMDGWKSEFPGSNCLGDQVCRIYVKNDLERLAKKSGKVNDLIVFYEHYGLFNFAKRLKI